MKNDFILDTWEDHTMAIENFREILEEVAERLPLTTANNKLKGKMERGWRKVKSTTEGLEKFIVPAKPIPVKTPWDAKEFTEAWRFWKDYLSEQHGFIMKTRMEAMALKDLVKITGNSPEKAIAWIEYASAHGYAKIFAVREDPAAPDNNNEKQNTTDGQKIAIPRVEIPEGYLLV